MKEIPPVSKVMTPFPWAISVDQPLAEARQMMDEHDIRHLPVTWGGDVVGLLSDRDLSVVEATTREHGGKESDLNVGLVCTADPYIVEHTERLDNVVLAMADEHIGSAIITREGELIGILTTTDVCRMLGEGLRDRQL
ncbi:MAG: CBS domain-containing protein [Myxococcota bacterium]